MTHHITRSILEFLFGVAVGAAAVHRGYDTAAAVGVVVVGVVVVVLASITAEGVRRKR